MSGRDRDAGGRARNARPRDELGRPLHRTETGVPVAGDEALPPAQALDRAERLLADGRPFHAHEILEAAWKAAPAAERDLWQGLAQIAVGLTHALRGNARGAAALLRRGAERISSFDPVGPHGVDVDGIAGQSIRLAARIEQDGLDGFAAADVRLRLRHQPGRAASQAGR